MITSKIRVLIAAGWFLLCCFSLWSLWTPIPFFALKVGFLLSTPLIALGALWLFPRQRKILSSLFLASLLTLFVIGLWPARAYPKQKLRDAYVSSLLSYLGTPYVWGGENERGIDCSGLVRRAMIDALVDCGWQDKNPSLWREAAQLWWQDCAARDMKDGSDWRFHARFETPNLNGLDDARLDEGDLAVTSNGVHVLAFIGADTWIQADPNLVDGGDKVILSKAPSENAWFKQKFMICRWKFLNS